MPIRRAAATPTQEKLSAAAAEKETEATAEESPSADEDQVKCSAPAAEAKEGQSTDEAEPTENGEKEPAEEGKEKKSDKCKDCLAGQCATHCYVLLLRLKDGYKYEKSKVKKVKRTIPAWASVVSNQKVPVTNYAGTQHKPDHIVIDALTSLNARSGVSYQTLMKYIVRKYPAMKDKKKFLIKKAMKKHLDNGAIKQLKGKGLSGTFAIGKVPPASKKAQQNTESLGDALPLIITRLCEPKEASYGLIKKYLMQHFPALNIEQSPEILKTALGKAIEKGQMEQITGKGASGTFQLKRTGNQIQLKGNTLDDAIIAAITAMNEPKTCSTTTLRKHLLDANKDRKEHILVSSLRRTLTKCKVLGWMEQITGHGFTGTYRLSFPFYPSPTVLYPERFKDLQKNPAPKRKQATSEEESEEEESEEESEDEAPVRRRKSNKRPPPKSRPLPSKSQSASRSKSRGSTRPLGKKSPVKKAPSSKKLASKPAAPKKESASVSKATPVKKGAPAKKPKTPAVKKLLKRGAKQPAPKDSSPDETEDEAEVPEEMPRGRSKRPKTESSPEPPAKKQVTKSSSRRSEPKESKATPVEKKGSRSNVQATRKSKRGKH